MKWQKLSLKGFVDRARIGCFKTMASTIGIDVETLDINPELKPDHIALVFDMPFKNFSFDVVCAFQMLEHLPFDKSIKAFIEMSRVTNKALIVSLPDSKARYPVSLTLPKLGLLQMLIPKPQFIAKEREFDGEHYWVIKKKGY